MAKSACFMVAAVLAAVAIAAPSFAQDTTTYTYDELGRVTTVTNPSGAKTGYNYDKADNRTRTQTALNGVLSMNNPPSCPSFTMTINPPTNNPVQVQIPFGSGCTDPDGDTITTNPAPYTVTVYIHTSTAYPYTASDGKGGTASATITVTRP